jgi:hypothetical protein
MIRLFVFFLLLFLNYPLCAEEQVINGYSYQKPTLLEPFTTIPSNLSDFLSESFKKETLGAWGKILASTTLLYIYDQKISNETKRFGQKIGIGNKDHTKDMVNLFGVSVFRGPTDFGSALYFLGDGWITLFSSATFLTVGLANNDNRALQTGSQLFSGLLVTGIITQTIKRVTGRESPVSSSKERGRWRPFPSWSKFQGHISAYDAFPSGHLATAIMGVTVMAENYQEYRFIKPFGYTLATLLAFQMINNDVHWISDYPLGIAIGYMVGKTVSKNGRTKSETETLDSKYTLDFSPFMNESNVPGLALTITY